MSRKRPQKPQPAILVGTYRKDQLEKWVLPKKLYNYPIHAEDSAIRKAAPTIGELWLYAGKSGKRRFSAKFEREVSVIDLAKLGYPRRKDKPHAEKYLLFRIEPLPEEESSHGIRGRSRNVRRASARPCKETPRIFLRLRDFIRSAKILAELRKQFAVRSAADSKRRTNAPPAIDTHSATEMSQQNISYFTDLPEDLLADWLGNLCVCEAAEQLNFDDFFKEAYTVKKPIKHAFVDLFAGCGGLSLGLEEAGFTPVLVNELNPDAMATYLANRVSEFPWLQNNNVNNVKDLVLKPELLKSFCDKIKDELGVDVEKGELDLVCGGPPCQGFSGIGFRRSYSVDKDQLPSNYLYQDMAFLVNRLNPKIFLFENVRGLLTSKWNKEGKNGEIFEDVLKTFRDIGKYHICFKLVHAKDYGVPQNRPRILIVGLRKDVFPKMDKADQDAVEAGFLPKPTGGAPNLLDLLGDLVDPSLFNGGKTRAYISDPKTEIQRRLRTRRDGSVMAKGEPLEEQDYSKHAPVILEKFTAMLENGGIIPERFRTKKFSQRLLPTQWGKDGPSITACSAPDDYVHFSQPRNLTVREWARLQMFPDWYVFRGKRTTGGLRRAGNPREGIFDRELPKYTQIGNAVPVGLAHCVGEHFIKLLEGKDLG
jgi:DNA (cytosine-5)-methyltransferase 1